MLPLDTLLVKPTSTSNSIATSSEPHHDSLLPDDTMIALVVPTTCESVPSTTASEPQSHPAPVHHSMTTQSQSEVFKPNPKYVLTVDSSRNIPPKQKTIKTALSRPRWKSAMLDELTVLHQNKTWRLVPRTSNIHVISSKWVFKTKLKPDGSLDHLKAHLVAKGYHQIDGLDYT